MAKLKSIVTAYKAQVNPQVSKRSLTNTMIRVCV